MSKATQKKAPSKGPGKQQGATAPAVPAQMSEAKQAQYQEHKKRIKSRPIRPIAKMTRREGGPPNLSHGDGENPDFFGAALYDLTGTDSPDFMQWAISIMSKIQDPSADPNSQDVNAGLAVMAAVQPENETETLLALQMMAANQGALSCTARMRNAQFVDQLNIYGNLANKFMRTYTAQMEALAKIRRGGEQVIKYVHVHEGGQAVIGSTINQHQGGRSDGRSVQSHAAAAVSGCAALPGPDEEGNGVPLPLDAEREMSDARRDKSGSTEGE